MFLQLTLFGPLATQYLPPCLTTFSAISWQCKKFPVANPMTFFDVTIIAQEWSPVFGVEYLWCWVASVNRQKRYEGAVFVKTKDRQFVLGRFVLFKNEIKNFALN